VSKEKSPSLAPTDRAKRAYWCFISYRHADNEEPGRQWASWLHQAIETYEVPTDLVGKANNRGDTIPPQIFPVFRDEEELPADSDLASPIYAALDRSKFLIVLCSPRSAASTYVGEEILYFKKIGRADRVLAALIEGEPNASWDMGKRAQGIPPEAECFPLPLQHPLDDSGRLDRSKRAEPIAADFRLPKGHQGWTTPQAYRTALQQQGLPRLRIDELVAGYARDCELAKLKILAGILGLPVGELTKRDQAYRLALAQKRQAVLLRWLILVGILAIAALGAFSIALWQRQIAEDARIETRSERDKSRLQTSAADYQLAALRENREERIAYLLRSLRYDPTNHGAAILLWDLLLDPSLGNQEAYMDPWSLSLDKTVFSPDSQQVALQSERGLSIWSRKTGELACPAIKFPRKVTMQPTPDHRMVVECGGLFYEVDFSGQMRPLSTEPLPDITMWRLSPNGRQVLLEQQRQQDGQTICTLCVVTFDGKGLARQHILLTSPSPLLFDIVPDGSRLYAFASDSMGEPEKAGWYFWDAATAERLAGPFGKEEIRLPSINYDGNRFYTFFDEISIWDTATGRVVDRKESSAAIGLSNLSPVLGPTRDQFFYFDQRSNGFRIFDTENFNIAQFSLLDDEKFISFSPDASLMLLENPYGFGAISLTFLPSGRQGIDLNVFKGSIYRGLSPDGNSLAMDSAHTVYIAPIQGRKRLNSTTANELINPDPSVYQNEGQTITNAPGTAAATWFGDTVLIWNPQTGRPLWAVPELPRSEYRQPTPYTNAYFSDTGDFVVMEYNTGLLAFDLREPLPTAVELGASFKTSFVPGTDILSTADEYFRLRNLNRPDQNIASHKIKGDILNVIYPDGQPVLAILNKQDSLDLVEGRTFAVLRTVQSPGNLPFDGEKFRSLFSAGFVDDTGRHLFVLKFTPEELKQDFDVSNGEKPTAIQVLEVASGRPLLVTQDVEDAKFHRNGEWLLAINQTQAVRAIRIRDGLTLKAPTNLRTLQNISFPRSDFVSYTEDKKHWLWDLNANVFFSVSHPDSYPPDGPVPTWFLDLLQAKLNIDINQKTPSLGLMRCFSLYGHPIPAEAQGPWKSLSRWLFEPLARRPASPTWPISLTQYLCEQIKWDDPASIEEGRTIWYNHPLILLELAALTDRPARAAIYTDFARRSLAQFDRPDLELMLKSLESRQRVAQAELIKQALAVFPTPTATSASGP